MSVQCFCGSWDHEPRHHPDIAAAYVNESRESLIRRIELLTADLDAEQSRATPAPLDVERLARALLTSAPNPQKHPVGPDDIAAMRGRAAAIAREYAEETK